MSLMSESHWWCVFRIEVKSWASTIWFRIWQFLSSAWKQYLPMHLLAKRFVFGGVMIWAFWKRELRPIKWHQFASQVSTLQLHFRLHIYSLWPDHLSGPTTSALLWIRGFPVSSRIYWNLQESKRPYHKEDTHFEIFCVFLRDGSSIIS